MRLLALDLDDTLSAPGTPVSERTIMLLRRVRATGCKIAIISGKPVGYLAGLARQAGLDDVVLAGENGATIQASHAFSPEWSWIVALDDAARGFLARLSSTLRDGFGDAVWLQPNLVNVTVFWRDPAVKESVCELVSSVVAGDEATPDGLGVYVHTGCIEVVAPGTHKGTALAFIARQAGVAMKDTVAVGDSANDIPMFAVAGLSLGVNIDAGDRQFENVDESIEWLLTEVL